MKLDFSFFPLVHFLFFFHFALLVKSIINVYAQSFTICYNFCCV